MGVEGGVAGLSQLVGAAGGGGRGVGGGGERLQVAGLYLSELARVCSELGQRNDMSARNPGGVGGGGGVGAGDVRLESWARVATSGEAVGKVCKRMLEQYVCVCVCVCVCVYPYIRISIYVSIYIHIYIYKSRYARECWSCK
jgi:hypothetical protein